MSRSNWTYDANSCTATVLSGTVQLPPNAFRGARKLQHIDFGDCLTIIPEDCCRHAVALKTARMPSTIAALGRHAFADCHALTKVNLPSGITIIPEGFLQRAQSLMHLELPPTIRVIGKNAFRDCAQLQHLILPEGLTHLHNGALAGAQALQQIHLPSSLCQLGVDALPKGGAMTKITVSADNRVYTTQEGALYSDNGRTLLYWPSNHPQTVLKIPEGTRSIAAHAFRGARKLLQVICPSSLKQVGVGAFAESSIEQVVFQSTPILDEPKVMSDGLFYSAGLNAFTWPGGISQLPAFAFAHSALASVELPENLQYIGQGAFYCTHLNEIHIPPSVMHIGEGACYSINRLHVHRAHLPYIPAALRPLISSELPRDAFLILPEGTIPYLVADEPESILTHLETICCSNNLSWSDFDEAARHFSSLHHQMEAALLRLTARQTPETVHALRYRHLLAHHARYAAETLIHRQDEDTLAHLLHMVMLSADELVALIYLADRKAAHGCKRLLSMCRAPEPRRFAI